ncbi:MAG: chemotaxis protein CheW, partial [Akkermansiaceae bacterium]|nr:chemotaxis protein CheW [Akkermansiaceae bacterium]
EVPPRPAGGLSDREFLARLALLYSEAYVVEVQARLRECEKAGDWEGVEALKENYLYRMWDLSQFMKTLKQRFTQWFNKRHGRRGTLWEDRFKSVIVQDGYAARVISAYIDLNPVRAGIVENPARYRWCGYAEALVGKAPARAGIERVMSELEQWATGRPATRSWRELIADYRVILYTDGEERGRQDERTGQVEAVRRGVSQDEAVRI